MERLTEKQSSGFDLKAMNGEWCNKYCEQQRVETCNECGIYQAIQKLAEYENLEELIGIPLKDIAEIFRQNIPEDCKHPQKAIMLTDDDVDRWNGYKNAEEQGLLLRLPCKVGSTVYHIANKRILEVENADVFFLCLCVAEGRFGKTVFLTQAEAEQKLKEMESD